MFQSKIADILSSVKVFYGLERADLKTIARYCQKMSFKKGEALIEIGQRSSALYIMMSGQVRVLLPEQLEGRKEHRAAEVNLNILREGDCFGEYSLIEKTRASASVVGVQDGEILRISEEGFQQIMDNDRIGKRIYYNLIHILIGRLRKKEEELDLVLIIG